MKRFLAILFTIALSGCLTYDSYGYRDDGYYEDRYYSGGRYHDDYAGYGSGYSNWDYPDYVYWSDYYSILWPVYRGYYDPFYTPGFYYGVTWYPRTYFGLGHHWNSWPYYHAYAPYRHSYWDGYYDRWDRRGGRHNHSPSSNQPYLYGSARNEAEQLAHRRGAAYQRSPEQPGVQYDPYAAQRTALPGRDPVRGHYPQRGLQSEPGVVGSGDLRARDALRRTQGAMPARQTQPYRESAPSRARSYDRGSQPAQQPQASGGGQSGWVGEAPARTYQSAPQRARPTPYYREVGGAQVPMTQRQPLESQVERGLPGRQGAVETRRFVDEDNASGQVRGRTQPYTYQQTSPSYQPIQQAESSRYQRFEQTAPRQQAPQREVYQQQSAPRFEAPQRYEAPERSATIERSRPERSESSSSARDEIRRSRDED